jgi:hypothetical protein
MFGSVLCGESVRCSSQVNRQVRVTAVVVAGRMTRAEQRAARAAGENVRAHRARAQNSAAPDIFERPGQRQLPEQPASLPRMSFSLPRSASLRHMNNRSYRCSRGKRASCSCLDAPSDGRALAPLAAEPRVSISMLQMHDSPVPSLHLELASQQIRHGSAAIFPAREAGSVGCVGALSAHLPLVLCDRSEPSVGTLD